MHNLQQFLIFVYENKTIRVDEVERDPFKQVSFQLFGIPYDYDKLKAYLNQIAQNQNIPQIVLNPIYLAALTRKKEDIQSLTAICIDDTKDIEKFPFKYHYKIETSKDKFQHWYILNPLPLEQNNVLLYTHTVQNIKQLTNSIENQTGIAKLVRLPNTLSHRNQEVFLTNIKNQNEIAKYNIQDLYDYFQNQKPEHPSSGKLVTTITDAIERNEQGKYPKGTRDHAFIKNLTSIISDPNLKYGEIESALNQWVINNLEQPEDFLTGKERGNFESKLQRARQEFSSLRPEIEFKPIKTEVPEQADNSLEVLNPTFPNYENEVNHFERVPGKIGIFAKKYFMSYPMIQADLCVPIAEQFLGVLASHSSFIDHPDFNLPPTSFLIITGEPGTGKTRTITIMENVLRYAGLKFKVNADISQTATPQGIVKHVGQVGCRSLLVVDDSRAFLSSAINNQNSLAYQTLDVFQKIYTAHDAQSFSIGVTKQALKENENANSARGLKCPAVAIIIIAQKKVAEEHIVNNKPFLAEGLASRFQIIVSNEYSTSRISSKDNENKEKILADLITELDTKNFISKANNVLNLRYTDLNRLDDSTEFESVETEESEKITKELEQVVTVATDEYFDSMPLEPSAPESYKIPCPEQIKKPVGRPVKTKQSKKHEANWGIPENAPALNSDLPEHLQSKIVFTEQEEQHIESRCCLLFNMRNQVNKSSKNQVIRAEEHYLRLLHLYVAWDAEVISASNYAFERVMAIFHVTATSIELKEEKEAEETSPYKACELNLFKRIDRSGEIGLSFREYAKTCPEPHRSRPHYNQFEAAKKTVARLISEGLIRSTYSKRGNYGTLFYVNKELL